MTRRQTSLAAGVAAVALVASACGLRGEGDIDAGVTEDPCPDTPNQDNGCIYLGTISDLTEGPFAPLGGPVTEGQEAFWERVNNEGGIGGYDIDVTTHVRDSQYDPQTHSQVYQEIDDDVLALAQSFGSSQTNAVIDDMDDDDIIAAPATVSSEWLFEDLIALSAATYCVESMNSVDYAVDELDAESVLAVHYATDYGLDGAGGAEIAAEERGVDFQSVETDPGQDDQGAAIQAVTSAEPDMVMLTADPTDSATIIGQSVARGYEGTFIGNVPSWNPGLLDSPAAEAVEEHYLQASPLPPWTSDTEGHEALRDALPEVQPFFGYTAGWALSYPLQAALEEAAEQGQLDRPGLREALGSLEEVDTEGMLPEGAGNLAGDANDQMVRESVLSEVDPDDPEGLTMIEDFFAGPTAEAHEMSEPCY